MLSNLYGKLKNSDENASCICKCPAQLFLWLVISAIVSFIFILPYCFDRIKTYSNVWNQCNECRDQRRTDTDKLETRTCSKHAHVRNLVRTRTWLPTKSWLRTRACLKTSETDSDTDILRTRVSAHLWSCHQNFCSCFQNYGSYTILMLFWMINWLLYNQLSDRFRLF